MKWIPQDIETFLSAKEYVDTAVLPIYSLSFGQELKQSAATVEFITLLTSHLERQFTGRILLMPPFTYLNHEKNEKVLSELKNWEEDISKEGFKHIFYLTSEINLRTLKDELDGSLVWLPSIPLEQMNDSQKLSVIDSQVKQLLNLFTQKWHEN